MRLRMRIGVWALALAAVVPNAPPAAATSPLTRETKLQATLGEAGDQLGQAIALSGTTLLVGAPTEGSRAGSADVFVRSGGGWSPQQNLFPDPGDGAFFGSAVALSGDTAVVGAYGDAANGDFAGAAYVFIRSGTTWSLQQKLTAADGAAGHFFGIAVAIAGNTATVGASGDDDRGTHSGSAYVFVRNGATWSFQQKIVPADGAANDNFGLSVALDGDTFLAGSLGASGNGAAYVFVRSGTNWSLQQKLQPAGGANGDSFGSSVALRADTALVGAYQDVVRGAASGAAYAFVRIGASWSQQQKLWPSDGAAGDSFGWSLALDGDRAIIGSPASNASGSDSGAAYLFDRSAATWTEAQKIVAADGTAHDVFGAAVALGTNLAAAGASGRSDRGTYSGAAYLFEPDQSAAPALGDYRMWAALLFAVLGLLATRRKALRIAAACSLSLAVGALASCQAPIDAEERTPPAIDTTEQALDPTSATVTLAALQDVSVRASAPNVNFRGILALDQNRTLIQFRQASLAAAVGPTDYVISAQLQMTLTFSPLRRVPTTAECYRLSQAWTEAGATFDCANDIDPQNSAADCSGPTAWSMDTPPNPWAVPASAIATVPSVLTGIARFDLTSDVRSLIHGDVPNFGWMIKGTTGEEFKQYASRETSTPPHLVLTIRRCTASACDDSNACTEDSCDATANCIHLAVDDGNTCSDGNACTENDACHTGVCVAGPPLACAPTDSCHTASCDPSIGCVTAPICSLITLAAGEDAPNGLAVDGTHVYWTTTDTIRMMPTGGGTPITLASDQFGANAIAVDAANAYWTLGARVSGSVNKVPLTGGAPVVLASNQASPSALAAGGSNVYWTTFDGGTVMRVPVGGGTPVTLASSPGFPFGIALQGGTVYWTNELNILKVPASGGTAVTLTPDMGAFVAVDGSSVYWATFAGKIMKMAIAGGAPVTLATITRTAPNENYWLAVDGINVYWTVDAAGTVTKVPVGGGAPTVIASGQATPRTIAVDNTSVYWTNFADGSVMKLSPK